MTRPFAGRADLDQVVPGLGVLAVHPVLGEEVAADLRADRDVEVGPAHPLAVDVGVLLAQGLDLPVLLDGVVDDVAHVDQLLFVQVGEDLAVLLDDVVATPGGHFGGHPGRQVVGGDVVDGGVNVVLRAPVLHEPVDPSVVGRHEVAPLEDADGFLAPRGAAGAAAGARRGTGRGGGA